MSKVTFKKSCWQKVYVYFNDYRQVTVLGDAEFSNESCHCLVMMLKDGTSFFDFKAIIWIQTDPDTALVICPKCL